MASSEPIPPQASAFSGSRSLLFVPGSRPERIPKALASDADAVIIDLEDAVAAPDKEFARASVEAFLSQNREARVLIRINSSASSWFSKDLEMCVRCPGVNGILVPKCETYEDIARVAATGKPVWPLVETVRGVLALESLLKVEGVVRASFGALDLCAELGLNPDTEGARKVLDQCRYSLVMHSFLTGLEPPIESVYPEISNGDAVAAAAYRAQEMGFRGMLCIHPKQVEPIHRAFTPDVKEVEWARRVLEMVSRNDAAFRLDGQMIDAPVIARARKILAILANTSR